MQITFTRNRIIVSGKSSYYEFLFLNNSFYFNKERTSFIRKPIFSLKSISIFIPSCCFQTLSLKFHIKESLKYFRMRNNCFSTVHRKWNKNVNITRSLAFFSQRLNSRSFWFSFETYIIFVSFVCKTMQEGGERGW